MDTCWSKDGSSTAPPHELNVWKFTESRARELESLHSIIGHRMDNNFQSQRNKRRRTTGHDNRVAKNKFRKRRRVGLGDTDKIDSVRKDDKKISRRVRRNIELKKNMPSGFGTSGDGIKRLRTHVWHAKRFKMKKAWGFHIPVGLNGRGRGSRALLKKLKHGVLMHDASYYGCVQLEGPEDILVSVLSYLLVPSPSACSEEVWNNILVGASFGTAMIHHAGKPCGPPIAPVTYLWRPQQLISTNSDGLSRDVFYGEQNIGNGSNIRQLWIWIHAAAFKEAYDALNSACEGPTCSAHCISREGHLAKLELIGSKVFQLLQKTLLPASSLENSWHMKKCLADKYDDHGELLKTCSFENGDQICSSPVISLLVKDPRAVAKKENVTFAEGKPFGLLGYEEHQIKDPSFSSFPKNKAECVFEYVDLWDSSKGICPPVEESVLCMEKHYQHKEFICLGNRSSRSQNAAGNGKCSRVCPILLLKNENHEDSVARCSIILPLSWVKTFWITFISNGAHAIGLREKHWVSCETGLPYLPSDFPDCNAFYYFMEMDVGAFCDKARLPPPPKGLPEVPLSPPWNCVHVTLGKISSKAEISLNQAIEFSKNEDIEMEKNSYEKSEAINTNCRGVPFQGIIARTSYVLNDFLNNTCANDLLLFPKLHGQKSCLYKFMKDNQFLKEDTATSAVKCGKTWCYLRVLVRAYKEGVFEQGAVVCAPHVADIMLCRARSECNNQNLQIPQSLVKSCFYQLPSGTWQLQVPDNPTLCESYRWPIGFITTGFVQGSKKARAGGFCEASLLSKLRKEQWKAFPVRQRRKEIYVLVRNIRSTAYQLALATIVLEQQEEDTKFM